MLEYLFKSLTEIEGQYPNCGLLLAGDFNRLDIKSLLRQFKMKQLVHLPSRKDQTLDLIITNLFQHYSSDSLSIHPPFELSDHNVVTLYPKVRSVDTQTQNVVQKRDTRRKSELGRYLCSINWSLIETVLSCEDKNTLFVNLVRTGLDIIMPVKDTKVHANNPPWITAEFKKLIQSRQRAFHENNVTLYRAYRNRINKERKRLRSNFFEMKISHLKETTQSLWWNEVKRISGMTPSADTKNLLEQLHLENVEANIQVVDLANRINNAFLDPTRIYQPLDPTTIERDPEHPTAHSAFELATEMAVYNILSKLNPRKASGPDCLPNWLLKTYAEILSRPICSIFNSSLLQQKLLSVWKHANVIPVPKQKPITIMNKHLQPISLILNVSKVASS